MSTTLAVHVIPGASREAVVGWHGDRLKLRVTAPAEKGKANKAIIRLLAKTLKVPASSIEIIRGHTHSDKLVELSCMDEDELNRLLPQKDQETSD